MAKFREIILPDGSKILELIPKTPEEITEDRLISERQRWIERRHKKDKKERQNKQIGNIGNKERTGWENSNKIHSVAPYIRPVFEPNEPNEPIDEEQDDYILEIPIEEKFRVLFDSFINKNGENGCWKWTGATNINNTNINNTSNGNGSTMGMAHAISYKMFRGKIIDGKHVSHKCNNGLCVNPQHLFLSSVIENIHEYGIFEDINPTYVLNIKKI